MIYITSDLHLSHIQPFLYEPRGCDNPIEHNEKIVENWNSIITDNDEVYILGDLIMSNNEEAMKYLSQLNGKIYFLRGNHDTKGKIDLYNSIGLIDLGYAYLLKYKKFRFYLSHYPTLCGNYDDGKKLYQTTVCLCGHTHTKDRFADWDKGIIYHCELDAHNCFPVSIDEIIKELREKIAEAKENV